ncbi:Thioredoxin [compost metagenome]
MSLIELNDQTFKTAVPKTGTFMVEFGAVWCPPCKALLPILNELSGKYGDSLPIFKVDCDESPVTAGSYGIMSMPTVIIFHEGEPVEKLVGLRPISAYENVISKYMKAA